MGYSFQLTRNDIVLRFSLCPIFYMQKNFIFQNRVFTKSIISHLFLNHYHRNNSIYKISTSSYRGKEEICRRMLRNFFSLAQFQRKRKSLVFFQSINFLWAADTLKWTWRQKCIYMLTHLSKGVPTKLLKFFLLKIFFICHRCQRHRWSTLSCEYLREFSKKFEMVLMGYSGAGG